LNIQKLFHVFTVFKKIIYGLGFYSFFIFAFGTPEFKTEVNTINKIYKYESLNSFYFNFFHTKNFFADKVPYTIDVDNILNNISAVTNRKTLYIVVQEKALASFFVQKVNLSAVGFFTYTPQKHSYSFLVPIFIENFYMKTAMYSYMFSCWQSGNTASLFKYYTFILNFNMYKKSILV